MQHAERKAEVALVEVCVLPGARGSPASPVAPAPRTWPGRATRTGSLSLLDAETALYVPEAFEEEGIALLERAFPRLRPLPAGESAELLACNGHGPDGRHFLVQAGCARTGLIVRELGFEVIELDTSEFLESGASVLCLKQMLP